MNYLTQTRSNNPTYTTFTDAILDPNADLGGLYTFANITSFQDFSWLKEANYTQICRKVFSQLGIIESLATTGHSHIESALQSYESFRHPQIAPLIQIARNLYCLELYHGPTFAFKDMALQPFSHLLDSLAKEQKQKYLILSATSGDTGPATLHGFANSTNIRAICIYPSGGTSEVQRLQMTTHTAPNLKVFGIHGNFDTAQSALKSLLNKQSFRERLSRKGYALSAANSVNIGRIAFQIVYYFVIAREMFKQGIKKFDVIVPSGNFGNALAGFFARELGVPITKLCIACNPNDILSEFFNTGVYDLRNKTLVTSFSPAMDILKSSNIERLLFAYFGAEKTKQYMESLDTERIFSLTKEELAQLQTVFEARSFSDTACLEGINQAFKEHYMLDPHTSNAYLFAKLRTNTLPTQEAQVILSTAYFAKFAKATFKALKGGDSKRMDALDDLHTLQEIQQEIRTNINPNFALESEILSLFGKKEIHTSIYQVADLEEEILHFCV
ncbi:threonine synthase [Helicobacter aurati]|uniref:Threonine synthase n=1 Tax=Helicobacter aurati TaxID=137778 RepID=A0A3D8J6W4_9HELI|nr:threonine synthase [Helicobacter aurati]RDU72856.1 threonine synthase [Helicobacter aurati]